MSRFLILNVAEKNSVAKEISQIMGGRSLSKRTGVSPYNPLYDFQYEFRGSQADMIFTSVSGHLMSLDFDEKYRGWYSCNIKDLFSLPVFKNVSKGMENTEKNLKIAAKRATHLVLWLDCDREGENIAFEVINVCTKSNPQLEVLRARFSSVTPEGVRTAWRNLGRPNFNDSLAVDARSELDLRLGAAFTRLQTLRLQKTAQLEQNLISYGPCQFPTMGFIVERYLQVKNFKPEDFWTIQTSLERDNKYCNFEWERHRLFDRLACFLIYEKCYQNPQAKVVLLDSHPTKKQ